jgi:lysophospholipase L1-like esterase
MKTSYLVLFLVIVIAFLFWFFVKPTASITNYPSSGTEIIAFGDSLIEGVGGTEGGDLVSFLSKKIGMPIINFGHSGDTTEMALSRLPSVISVVPRPKVVIILLGGNDYLQKVPKEKTFSNLGKIIFEFQKNGAVVLLLGVRGGILKDNFDADFIKLRDTYHTAFVSNVLDGLITNPALMFDGIHPNNAGYEKIASRVYPVLKKIVTP